ncbi:MAG TPA: STAS domain-containing protein [Nocardioidaceae bacterium]|nr:STAS domain-containing protein [Nocardioidaceae bacterium]
MTHLGRSSSLRLSVRRVRHAPHVRSLSLAGRVAPGDADALEQRVEALLERGFSVLGCDVGALRDPDVATADALARLRLACRRHGCDLRLRRVQQDLHDLLAVVGLHDLLLDPVSGGGMLGQAEQREEARGVEERVDPGDPAV